MAIIKKQKKWHQKWWGIIFLIICVLAFIYSGLLIYQIIFLIDAKNQINGQNINSLKIPQAYNIRDTIEKKDSPFLGDENAAIVIVEFGDFQCPVCKQEALIVRMIAEEDPSLKIIFRNFPNPVSSPQALTAAMASLCANEQGKFWEYHDLLFENQTDLSSSNLKALALNLGLNSANFNNCLDEAKYFSQIKSDMQDGLTLNITGTPTFYINGNKLSGGIPYNTFKTLIAKIKQSIAQ
ncbi:DsbA family protein [Candidatus Falkowbacteria bacterium]|nr:DsbA family protein [Candidatus Falkowbacteria bacterium]